MFTDAQTTSIRLLCLMLTAASVYSLARPRHAKIGNVFWRVPLTVKEARVFGVIGLVIAAALFIATF